MIAVWLKALMIFLIAVIVAVLSAELASESGLVRINWLGWQIETSVAAFFALLGVLLLILFILRPVFRLLSAMIEGLFSR